MNWFLDNLPVISSAFVGVGSVLISFIKLFRENDASAKKIKRLVDLSDIYTKLPSEMRAKDDLGKILEIETAKFKDILTRKINFINLSAVIIMSILGGFMSYLLVLWATNSWILWSVIAWTLFAVVAFFTIGIAIVGLSSLYESSDKKEKKS